MSIGGLDEALRRKDLEQAKKIAEFGPPTGTQAGPQNVSVLPINVNPEYARAAEGNFSVGKARDAFGLDWQRKWAESRYKDLGYKLGARPYEYDPSKFVDPMYASNQAKIAEMMAGYGGRNLSSGVQGSQDQYLAALLAQAQGQGPSVALDTFQTSKDQALKSAMAFSNSATGPSAAAARRGAQFQMGDIVQGAARDAAAIRASEMARAGQMFTGLSGEMRTADIQNAQLNDQMVQYFMSQGLTLDQAQWQAQMSLQEMMGQQHTAAQQTANKIGAAVGSSPKWGLAGAGIGAAATIGAAISDKRLKTNIKESPEAIRKFLDAIKAYRFKYDGKVDASGKKRFGIMAQDLEKSDAGQSLIIDMKADDGKTYKAVDTTMAVGTLLAAAGDLNKRVKMLEAVKSYSQGAGG